MLLILLVILILLILETIVECRKTFLKKNLIKYRHFWKALKALSILKYYHF